MNSSRGDVPALNTCNQANNMSTILKQKLHNNRAYTYIYIYYNPNNYIPTRKKETVRNESITHPKGGENVILLVVIISIT